MGFLHLPSPPASIWEPQEALEGLKPGLCLSISPDLAPASLLWHSLAGSVSSAVAWTGHVKWFVHEG